MCCCREERKKSHCENSTSAKEKIELLEQELKDFPEEAEEIHKIINRLKNK